MDTDFFFLFFLTNPSEGECVNDYAPFYRGDVCDELRCNLLLFFLSFTIGTAMMFGSNVRAVFLDT